MSSVECEDVCGETRVKSHDEKGCTPLVYAVPFLPSHPAMFNQRLPGIVPECTGGGEFLLPKE